MASIGRWLYRLFSICLPCLKSAETDEKDTEDHPPNLNYFENDTDGNPPLENKYPDDLNPFASDEENENPIGKVEKEQRDEYPDTLNPFATDDKGNEDEIKYPEELNPFADEDDDEADSAIEQPEDEYPDTLNPFAIDDEGNEDEIEYPDELNKFADEDDDEADSAIEQPEDEYPDTLNPFAIDDDGNEDEIEYPEELNPFADEEDGKADSAIVTQSSLELDHELTPSVKKGLSATVPLSDEENTDGKDESKKKGNEYPEWLNPFASSDEESERETDYPEELNPFAQDDDEVDTGLVKQPSAALSLEKNSPATNSYCSTFPWLNEEKFEDEQDETEQKGEDYPDIINPFASKDDEDDYPEELNPFAHEDVVPMPQSAKETSRSVPSIYKVIEYDEALNPFASEDVENKDSTLENSSMAIDPQRTTVAVNGSPSLVPLANERKKRKSTKKYRAPDPPMTMRIIPNESAPGLNESSPGVNESAPAVNELGPGVKESVPEVKESAPGINKSDPVVNKSDPGVNESDPGVNESDPGHSEILGPVPLTVKVDDYDEALNPFASEDGETAGDTTGTSPAQPTASTAYSCISVCVERKVKSSKKRRAPNPPVIESTSDIIAIQPCASSSNPGTKESEA